MLDTTLLNRYRIESELGHGGMGTIYHAFDTLLDRAVAVKVVSNAALGTEGRARLLREARSVAKLNHPNIMAVYDAGEVDGTPFIVMELIEGQTLREHPPESIGETIYIAQHICAALEHAHAKGIIHRDLKPENVMLLPSPFPYPLSGGTAGRKGEGSGMRVKLMDFGLAFSTGASRLTQEDMIIGTVAYLAPELIEGQPASSASDLYALGVMLYELTTGCLPFAGADMQTLLAQHLHAPVTPASTYNSEITPTLDLLLMRLLAKKSEQRPASALEVQQVLEKISAGEGVTQPAIEAPRTNLPAPLTSFIGREKELARIQEKLADYRLVTLTGSGGVGKTRLAIQAAQNVIAQYPHGAWLIELAPLADPELVPQAVMTTLDLQEDARRPPLTVLTDYLREKTILLVLDNCEHVIDACAQLTEQLLIHCPNLRILASSREALGIDGEVALRVPSLSLPSADTATPESLVQSEAAQLFVDRAAAALPGFALTEVNAPAIAQVCRRLDGIALAIELAASRVKVLRVEQIADRLDDAFRLLTGGRRTALPRQQTLRATIDWSYNLLAEVERILLRRLAVFAGGAMLEAVEAICADDVGADPRVGPRADTRISPYDVLDVLTQLVNKSLVVAEREQGDEARYYLLETIRQYAREKLNDSGEGEAVRERHTRWYVELAERAEPKLHGHGQLEWLDRLDEEHDNLRAALEWSLERNVEVGLQLATKLYWWWLIRCLWSESREWLTKLLACPESSLSSAIRANALNVAGYMAWFQEDYESAYLLHTESLAMHKELGLEGRQGIADSLFGLGRVSRRQGDLASACAYYEETLAIRRDSKDKQGIAYTLLHLGAAVLSQGNLVSARSLLEESLTIWRELGDKSGSAPTLNNLGEVVQEQGDYVKAEMLYTESLALFREFGDKFGMGYALNNLGYVALHQNNPQQAGALFRESLAFSWILKFKRGIATSFVGLAAVAAEMRRAERAAQLMGAAQAFIESADNQFKSLDLQALEPPLDLTHAQLEDSVFDAAWSAGYAMTLDEAIEYALSEA